MKNEKIIFDRLMKEFNNAIGVCALIGNLYAESGLLPNNLQNSGNKYLGLSDEEYTRQVDNGIYKNFVRDCNGYGLAQWTYYARKQNLLNFAKARGVSIGDLYMQISFLIEELKAYKNVYNAIKNATNLRDCSDIIVKQYEKPANQKEENLKKRASFGYAFYDELTETHEKSYTVVKGDTLWCIAKKFYGSGLMYTKLMRDNNLTTSRIEIGQVLIIKEKNKCS